MSGPEPPEVVVGGIETRAVTRLLGVLGRLGDQLAGHQRRLVLIGGLAVVVRVASADRATADIDSVFDVPTGELSTIELLAAAQIGDDAGPDAPQRRIIEGTPVDCIDTHEIEDDGLVGLPDEQALFVGAHRFAFVNGISVVLRVGDRRASVDVATSSALVATKLHAARYRRKVEKLGSDLFDLYRLLTSADQVAMATELSTWPRLASLVRDGITHVFVEHASRSAGRLRTIAAGDGVRAEDLRAVGEVFTGLLPR